MFLTTNRKAKREQVGGDRASRQPPMPRNGVLPGGMTDGSKSAPKHIGD